jgi:hypothetical protein
MRFRLVYEGSLPSDGSPKDKHAIRRQLHGQLKELWTQHEALKVISDHYEGMLPNANEPGWSPGIGLRQIASQHARCGFEFVPLVSSRFRLVCSIGILFLRRENPGAVVSGGDIDNRLKTLFDGLCVPNCDQVVGEPEADEKPMFCLLEDDRLVTEVRVTTDRLLSPLGEGQSRADVLLIISVELEQTSSLW